MTGSTRKIPSRATSPIERLSSTDSPERKRTSRLPDRIGSKVSMLERWIAQFPVGSPATGCGYSRKSSVAAFHCVTTTDPMPGSASSSASSAGPHAEAAS